MLGGHGRLHGQALYRLLLVGLLATAVITMVAANNYYNQRQHEIDQRRLSLVQFYEAELPQLDDRWRFEATQIKSRIEFSRLLEHAGSQRWSKLTAMLNAQAELSQFSNLLIVRNEVQILYRHGSEANQIKESISLLREDWHFSPETHELYRIFRMPIWLGGNEQAELLLLKTVNHSALKSIAVPETQLHLYYHDQVLATSAAIISPQVKPGDLQTMAPNGVLLIQADIKWPGNGVQPVLITQLDFHISYPLKEFLLRPVVAISVIVFLIWFGMGRWLTRTVNRITSLEQAADEYASNGLTRQTMLHIHASIDQPDEIADLAYSMNNLMHDVDKRNLEQQAYLDTISMLDEAVLELSRDGVILRTSAAWERLTHNDDPIGKHLDDFVHEDDREALRTHLFTLARGDKQFSSTKLRLHDEAHHVSWLECRFVSFGTVDGRPAGIRGILRDITQTYQHEKQITHMALHDALTGLPNRILLEDRIKVALRQAARAQNNVAICFIDLDHFKNVNDSLGHKSGDKLLLEFSARIKQLLREVDTVARWGGDEFVLLLPDMASEQDIREIALKIGKEMQRPLHIEETDLAVTYSMGVALYPNDGEEIGTLFSHADRAMFYAKSQGRNQTCFFHDMSSKGLGKKELYVQNRLATAIAERQIQAWYQPVISVSSGRCVGVEVLARWHDREHGWISPSTFVPMAENLGLIHELGQQVLLACLADYKRWKDNGASLTMAINVSKRQLFTPNFTERLLAEVNKYQLPPAHIKLEVTESLALLDVEHAVDRLLALKNAGFRIALDDFGTGYSSLSQLHEMHVDELKIDISFVRRLNEPSGLSMTQAIINLAQALNLETVAEGVESAEAAEKLRELGANYLQGYHFAKPMSAADFEVWLQAQSQDAQSG